MASLSKSPPLDPTLVKEYEPLMYGLLPHDERRMRRGFGMSGFPVDGREEIFKHIRAILPPLPPLVRHV